MDRNSEKTKGGKGIPLGVAAQEGQAEDYLDVVPHEQDEIDNAESAVVSRMGRKNQRLAGLTGDKGLIEETMLAGPEDDPLEGYGHKKILDREDDYHKGRLRRRELSPEREDAFA